jgi:cell division transport system ATP-binding protein
MITLQRVTKSYPPDQTALRQVDLRVGQGDFLFLAGASGAGKSTLLKLLYAAEQPSSGEVVVAGRNLATLDRDGIAELRSDIGVVFQDYKLLQDRTVLDNVAYALEIRGVSRQERRSLALKLLAAIGLEDRADMAPRTLSGGEQQRVALARALIHRPKVLLADEPTGNLDPEMSARVFDLLMEANAAGVTVVVATHNLGIIEELNLRTIVLDRGGVLGDFQTPRGVH